MGNPKYDYCHQVKVIPHWIQNKDTRSLSSGLLPINLEMSVICLQASVGIVIAHIYYIDANLHNFHNLHNFLARVGFLDGDDERKKLVVAILRQTAGRNL